MSQFEYKTTKIQWRNSDMILNSYGRHRWELVSVTRKDEEEYLAIFKRPVRTELPGMEPPKPGKQTW